MKTFLTSLLALFMFAGAAVANERGSLDDAKAMAIKAANLLKAKGSAEAFSAINTKGGSFHDRDLYVAVFEDKDGKLVTVAHGNNPGLMGKDIMELTDVDGTKIGRAFAQVKDEGWVAYKWQNPQSKKVEGKKSFMVRVGDYLVGCGAYAE